MIHQIYIFTVIVITAAILMYYYAQEADYRREIDKINRLEIKNFKEQRDLDIIRSQTMACPRGDFKTPRSCYFDSEYMCSWNDVANRCDMKN
jgi:hypothetical protein